ncbi:hypothetical protein Tco_1320442 [Tanacetum coccineum]
MKESEAYKTYHDLATGKVQPKPKYVRQSTRSKIDEAPKPSSGKRVKATAKVAKSGKKKQPALGLETLSDIALTKAERMKLAIERSKTQLHISQPSGSGAHEGTDDDDEVNVSEHEDGDDDERTESENDGDDFVHPKISTHDDEARKDDEVNEEESNEESDKEVQGVNTEEEEMNKEVTHEEDKANELYRDVNVNLERRDTVMTDAPLPNMFRSPLLLSHLLCLQQLFHPLHSSQISNKHQYPRQQLLQAPPYKIFPTLALYSVSSIPGIVDAYLANKMHEAVKTAVQFQSERLRDEALAKNEAFLNSLDDNIKKIIKDQVKQQVKAQVSKILPRIEKTVNEQFEAEVMTRSSTESKTSHVVAANLYELELKKILIDKMESNKLIHKFDEQENLYKALVDAYESDKLILDTYGDTVSFKRQRDDEDKDEEPSARSNRGSKRRRARKEHESTSAPKEKTSKTTGKSTEGSKSYHKSAGEFAQA